MKIAVCDIGSNTIKMKIYECENNQATEIYSSVANSKLISHIQNGELTLGGIQVLCEAINRFKNEAEKNQSNGFYAFATASLRRCKNCDDIIDIVKNICNVNIDLISGDDEAYLSFQGVKRTTANFPANCILLDMGGGSTEIVVVQNGEKIFSHSMNFGSLSLSLDFKTFEDMKENVIKLLENANAPEFFADTAILVGGTALAINKIYGHIYHTKDSYTMEFSKLSQVFENLKTYSDDVKSLLNTLTPDRTTTVVPGLAGYMAIFESVGITNIQVSTKGIREGYVYERLLK